MRPEPGQRPHPWAEASATPPHVCSRALRVSLVAAAGLLICNIPLSSHGDWSPAESTFPDTRLPSEHPACLCIFSTAPRDVPLPPPKSCIFLWLRLEHIPCKVFFYKGFS